MKLDEITERLHVLTKQHYSQQEVLRWIDVCSGTQPNAKDPAFLKVRAHIFQRNTQGIWACVDKDCRLKHGTPLDKGWPFGYVYVNQRQNCDCGSPVYEVAFCNDCNEPHLLARDKKGKLVQWENKGGDEFSLQDEVPVEHDATEEKVEKENSFQPPLIIAAGETSEAGYTLQRLDRQTRRIGVINNDSIPLIINDIEQVCSASGCGYRGMSGKQPFRRALLGGPFYVTNIVPTVLEYCQDFTSDEGKEGVGPDSLPGRGRRLITFTDSRQGTARMAVRMQQEAERSRLRGSVVEILSWHQRTQTSTAPNANADLEKLAARAKQAREQAEEYRSWGMPDQAKLSQAQAEQLEQAYQAATGGKLRLSWYPEPGRRWLTSLKREPISAGRFCNITIILSLKCLMKTAAPLSFLKCCCSGNSCVALNGLTAWKHRGWFRLVTRGWRKYIRAPCTGRKKD